MGVLSESKVPCRDMRKTVRVTDMKGDAGQGKNNEAAEKRAWLCVGGERDGDSGDPRWISLRGWKALCLIGVCSPLSRL